MRTNFTNGLMFGAGILLVVVVGIAIAVAADILTVDKDGTIRLRVSDQGKVTLNSSDAAQGDLRFTPRSSDPTAPLAGDLWYNDTVKEVKYSDGGTTKPLAEMTNADISLYVDGTNGNDNNNGLTSGTAVKTIQKAVNLIPSVVRHAVTINIAAGTYRDLGATVDGSMVNVYVSDKVTTTSGSIAFQGATTLVGASSYRVTGSNSGADTTPVRKYGFFVSHVVNVNIKGIQCDYFTQDGFLFQNSATGDMTNCIADNNKGTGIRYYNISRGSPASCQVNNNGTGAGATWPKVGIMYDLGSVGHPQNCTVSNNGNHGMYYRFNSFGWPGYGGANGGTGNAGYGIFAELNSSVLSVAPPSGTLGDKGDDFATGGGKVF